MKNLKDFINESRINEDIDDNLFWLLDKWFERNENQKSEFISILVQCRQEGDKVSIDNLKKLLHNTELKKDLKEFINFLSNDLEPQNNKDYLYELKQVIEVVIGKKENNKYLENNKETQVSEKLIINKNTKIDKYHYHPKDKDELFDLVHKLIKERGEKADLNDIDTSKIDNMSGIFLNSDFNGDISEWDVSNVKNMLLMFNSSKFDGDLSKWDVSNVTNMVSMFAKSEFTGKNGDISNWDVSKVKATNNMFKSTNFNQDISKWDVRSLTTMGYMFKDCPIEKNPPKWYKSK